MPERVDKKVALTEGQDRAVKAAEPRFAAYVRRLIEQDFRARGLHFPDADALKWGSAERFRK